MGMAVHISNNNFIILFCSKFWCRNRPGDEMDKYNCGVNALVMREEDSEGKSVIEVGDCK